MRIPREKGVDEAKGVAGEEVDLHQTTPAPAITAGRQGISNGIADQGIEESQSRPDRRLAPSLFQAVEKGYHHHPKK
jgi:hypothetical protein